MSLASPARPLAAFALAGLQLVFALTWVVYVLYLPGLLAQAGVSTRLVPWLLLVDQLVFVVADTAFGVAIDRSTAGLARAGRWILAAMIGSAALLALMPLLAAHAPAAVLVAAFVVWSAASSALRAPPLAAFAPQASRRRELLVAGYAGGLALAGAVAPYLTPHLAAVDPRLPMAAIAIVLAVLAVVTLRLAQPGDGDGASSTSAPAAPLRPALLACGVLALAIGYQVHVLIGIPPSVARVGGDRTVVADLVATFWLATGLAAAGTALLPAAIRAHALVAGAALGACGLTTVAAAGSLTAVVVGQVTAGVAWGLVLTAILERSQAVARRGLAAGLVFSMLALAAVGRLAMVVSSLAERPELEPVWRWTPPGAWLVGALAVVAALAPSPAPGAGR